MHTIVLLAIHLLRTDTEVDIHLTWDIETAFSYFLQIGEKTAVLLAHASGTQKL